MRIIKWDIIIWPFPLFTMFIGLKKVLVLILSLNTTIKITAFYHIVTRWNVCHCSHRKRQIKIDYNYTKCEARIIRIDKNGKKSKQYYVNCD